MKDEMQELAHRIATGRKSPKKMMMEQDSNRIPPEQMKKMKRLGGRMSDRLISRFH